MKGALGAHGIYRVDLEEASPLQWALTVEADTGTAVTLPLALSQDAAMELERRVFRIPEATDVH